MDAPVAGFLKVSTTDGRTLYLNAHHVTAIEAASGEVSAHLHSGKRISLAETAEAVLQPLRDLQAASGAHARGPRRLRERRRRGRSA
jgi:uncharacterized protein YlzI (FlbEa/FlbD family)